MKILSILTVGAAALAPLAAHAQIVDPPEKWEDTPEARLNLPDQPGVSWQVPAPQPRAATPAAPATSAPATSAPATVAPAPAPPQASAVPAAPAPVARRPAPPPVSRPAPPPAVAQRPAPAPRPSMPAARPAAVAERPAAPPPIKPAPQRRADHARHAANAYADYRRIDRGRQIDRYWAGADYRVPDHHRYGFAAPRDGERWVRYYDDALLVDRRGIVRDGRYGLDWDQYGEGWGYDDRGIPAYVGAGDFVPGREDYAWVESHDPRCPAYADEGGAPAYPYGYHPYGYYYAYGPVTITETTVTTTTEPVVTTRTYYVDEAVRSTPRAKPRRSKAKAVAHPGERG